MISFFFFSFQFSVVLELLPWPWNYKTSIEALIQERARSCFSVPILSPAHFAEVLFSQL